MKSVLLGSTSVVSRVHFELLLVNDIEFHLKCLSKNGIFINNNYTKMSSTTVLPKQYDYYIYILFPLLLISRCTLRFPSTDLCISFSCLLNNNNLINRTSPRNISRHVSPDTLQRRLSSSPMDTTSFVSLQSVPNVTPQQQIILVALNQQAERTDNQELNNSLPPLSINIPNASSSSSNGSSLSAGSNTEQRKSQHESPRANNNCFLG
jgi:hypothetical protein